MFTPYITKEGDTWSLIAFKAYGDVNKFPEIQGANPNIPWTDTLQGNLTIFVPIQEAATQQATILPPWKRKNG